MIRFPDSARRASSDFTLRFLAVSNRSELTVSGSVMMRSFFKSRTPQSCSRKFLISSEELAANVRTFKLSPAQTKGRDATSSSIHGGTVLKKLESCPDGKE